jgi:hypothetical protein
MIISRYVQAFDDISYCKTQNERKTEEDDKKENKEKYEEDGKIWRKTKQRTEEELHGGAEGG